MTLRGSMCRSISLDPTWLAYANRAMARLKLKSYAGARDDCTQALQLNCTYGKTWQRRATANRSLGDHVQAAYDFEEALRYGA